MDISESGDKAARKKLEELISVVKAGSSFKWRLLAVIVAFSTVVGALAALISLIFQAFSYFRG